MSEMTRGFVQGYLDAFDAYEINGPALQQQVDELRKKMYAFDDAHAEPTQFYGRFAESGLQEEYSALIARVAMASMGSADAEGNVKTDCSDTPAPAPLSVRDFVEQYRVPYEEVRKAGYRKRGEAAYEKILALADEVDDMLDAQIIMEEERLLWNIVSWDSLDIFEPILQALDPLQPTTTVVIERYVQLYREVQGSEELDYALERLEFERVAAVLQATGRMNAAAHLAFQLLGYCSSKLNAQRSGGGQKDLRIMIGFRSAARRALRLLDEELGMTFDDLLADEGLKIWLLSPQNVDELGRIKESLHPQNYDLFKDIVDNEILSDLSILQLLKRRPEKAIWYGFDGSAQSAFRKRAAEKAKELNAHLTYYQYREHLKGALEASLPQGRNGGKEHA